MTRQPSYQEAMDTVRLLLDLLQAEQVPPARVWQEVADQAADVVDRWERAGEINVPAATPLRPQHARGAAARYARGGRVA